MGGDVRSIFGKGEAGAGRLSREELACLLGAEGEEERAVLEAAYRVKVREVGKRVSVRGLIEMGNACAKDCFYCGIRKGNTRVERYVLEEGEVVRMAKAAAEQGYGSVVLQEGELEGEAHTARVERILRGIREACGDGFGVTLSLGEQEPEVYRRWRAAGAHRYLLRIETSNPRLYAALHPAGHSWVRRAGCLRSLRELGYQTGTGVMWGLPGQTLADLAGDIEFYREMDIDMIGMGPWIPHPGTPLGDGRAVTSDWAERQVRLGLKMIAATRLQLHDVNIAATTAMQALDPKGREKALLAGANVVMPNVTDREWRENYQLYPGKPCLDEGSGACAGCLEARVRGIGETLLWGVRGDAPHATKAGRG
jgi:biotin synthase